MCQSEPYYPLLLTSFCRAEDESTKSLLLGCFDGHGECGHKVSQYFKAEVETRLFQHPSFKSCVKTAIKEVVAAIETELLYNHSVDTNFSGTTMVLAVVQGQNLVIANVGDSRATLGSLHEEFAEEKSTTTSDRSNNNSKSSLSEKSAMESGRIVSRSLTIDHKPELPEERERILGKGGRIFAITYENGISGPERVWHNKLMVPGLAMSRSFCDTVAHAVGVSSEPEFIEITLDSEKDCVLILATDGLWEFLCNQEAVEIAIRAGEPSVAVNELIRESSMRWLHREGSVDDTTVCVAFLEGSL